MNNIKSQIKEELNEIANKHYDGTIKSLCWAGETEDELVAKIEAHYNKILENHPDADLSNAVNHYFC